MDPRALLHQSPQETPPSSSRSSAPEHYQPPPAPSSSPSAPSAPLAPPSTAPSPQETSPSSPWSAPTLPAPSSSPSAPNAALAPPSPAPSPQETSPSYSRSAPAPLGSSSSASAPNVPRAPPSPSPCIKIEETSDEVHIGGATATTTDDETVSDEAPAHSSASSTPPNTSSGAAADARRSTFWRFLLPRRDPDPTLPVTNTNPQPVRQSKFRRFKEWHKSCQGPLLPDGVIQIRIAVCGFAFYGIMAMFNNTWDLIKGFSENHKVTVLFLIGLLWTVATICVPVTMSARTTLDKALSQHVTRLVLLGITLHMLFNISLMLPQNVWMASKMNLWSLVVLVLLLALAIIGHVASWIQSSVYGEVEEKPTVQSGNNTANS